MFDNNNTHELHLPRKRITSGIKRVESLSIYCMLWKEIAFPPSKCSYTEKKERSKIAGL